MSSSVRKSLPPLSSIGLQEKQITTDPFELLAFDRDAGIDRGIPDAVAFPESTEDVIRIVEWAGENRVPLIPRGAGTGLTGGAVAEHGGVILQFSRLNRLIDVDLEARLVRFQPGLINGVLDQLLKDKDWYYPPDPGSGRSATMGGTIAENAGGPHCLKYGVTGNYLRGMRVVLSNGQTVQLGGPAVDYPELDFVGLITGSEGTLAIVTEAWARIVRRPPGVETLMVAFDSVEACGEAVSAVIAAGIIPACLEMMDQKIVRIVENHAHAGLPVDAEAVLIVEVDGYVSSVAPQMEEISAVLKRAGAYDFRWARTDEERARIWNARKSAGGAITRLAPAYYPADATVPRSKLAATLAAINRICDEAGLRVGYALHAGDGNLHPHILIENPNDTELRRRVQAAGARVMEWCVAAGGSITGEHGIGIEKRDFLPLMYNPAELQAMRDVKEIFDPADILNPGKILPAVATALSAGEFRRDVAAGNRFVPTSAEEAAEAFRSWNQLPGRVPVRIEGGKTKSFILDDSQVVLSTERLKGIIVCAPHDLYVTVGAGTSVDQLHQELDGTGMHVPIASPWPGATIGGIISSNFNAPLRSLYGGLRDLVLTVTAVLPDGRLIRLARPFAKDVAGYDLKKLFVGAFGSLGLVAEVTLRLFPLPRLRDTLVLPAQDLGTALRWANVVRGTYRVCAGLLLVHGSPDGRSAAPWSLVCTLESLPEEVGFEASLITDGVWADGANEIVHMPEISATKLWADFLEKRKPSEIALRIGVPFGEMGSMVHEIAAMSEIRWLADLSSSLIYAVIPADAASPLRLYDAAREKGGYALMIGAPPGRFRREDVFGYRPESASLIQALKQRWDPRGILPDFL